MKLWREYGPSIRLLLAQITALALFLTWLPVAAVLLGCAPSLSKPTTVSQPPAIPCKVDQMPAPPEIPELAQMDEWAIQVMGLMESQAVKIRANAVCMAQLRKEGVIR